MVDVVVREMRQAARRLVRAPGFTLAAIVTLALGIGADVAVFSVVDAVLLRPLPYRSSERLLALTSTRRGDEISISYPDLQDWRARNRTLESIAGYVGQSYTLTGSGAAERLRGQVVSSDLFRVLGVQPARGRAFGAEEDEPGTSRVVLISHGVWERQFGSAPDIVGRVLRLNSEPYMVVGVMPANFAFPDGLVYGPADVWVPIGLVAGGWTDRGSHPGLYAVARVRDGVPVDAARADLTAIAASLAAEYPATNTEIGVAVERALDSLVGATRPALLALLAAVALILLIVCANVANLLLVRTMSRSGESRIRAALGASRMRLLVPGLAESVWLALAGGVGGVLLAFWLTSTARGLLGLLPRVDVAPIDARVLAFAATITLLTVVLCGLLPGVHALRDRSGDWLRGRGGGRIARRARSTLVVAEIALALVVLIGAGLVVKSFARLLDRDPGIDAAGVLTFQVRLPEAEYGEGEPVRTFYGNLFERIDALPGVTYTSAISTLPFTGAGSQAGMTAEGQDPRDARRTDVNVVTPGYFATMGIALLAGRVFDERDHGGSAPVVVIDERLAATLWPGAAAVGRRVSGWGLHNAEVVGVVRHVRNYGVTAASREELYMTHTQRPFYSMRVLVRTIGDPAAIVPDVRSILGSLDAAVPLDNPRLMADFVAATLGTPRLLAVVGGGFALLAVLLAAVGIHGVIASGVVARTREIGTRVALGAGRASVIAMVVGHGARLALAGIAIGTVVAFAVTRLLESQIHDVSRTDGTTFLLLPTLLFALSAFASWLPARRAARISPVEAMRVD